MNNIKINTTDIQEIKNIIHPSLKRVIRGQANKDWKLDCSFFRKKRKKYITCKKLFGLTWNDNDENLLKTTFPCSLENESIKFFPHLGLLVQIQQNFINSTPLLDVSSDIYMPLFCACGEGREYLDKDGKIFVIESTNYCGGCNELENSEMQILSNDIIPTYNNRMQRQNGLMIKTCMNMYGDLCFCDITKAGNKKISEYIIPAKNKKEILINLKYELKCDDLNKYFYE